MLKQVRAAIVLGGLIGLTAAAQPALAEEVDIDMHLISEAGIGDSIGTIHGYNSENGLVLRLELAGLPAGPHGFHLHENGDCGAAERDGQMVAGLAAGNHYDPDTTGSHLGPSGEGHKGDLPVLYVEPEEAAQDAVVRRVTVAPRLAVADLHGRALVIHAGGDNYRDEPKPLGGGGARIACGVAP